MKQLKGLGTALVTPFNENGSLDYAGLEKLVLHNIHNGVDYLVIQGTTGETATLSKQERIDVYKAIVATTERKVPLVLGIGGNNTLELIKEYDWFDLDHVVAILSASPAYNKPTQSGIIAHYQYLSQQGGKPIILYNVPGRTASNVLPETTLELAKDPNIIAVKEASGSVEQIAKIIRDKPHDFLVISGDDGLTLPLIALGADGLVSVISNAFPKEMKQLIEHCFENKYAEARKIHYALIKPIELIFKENNPSGIKALLNILDICGPNLRLPLLKASPELTKLLSTCI